MTEMPGGGRDAALPIDAVLPRLLEEVGRSRAVLLSAPPGAGKTTRVPPALLRAGLVEGQLVLLQPRRLAARAVAAMMARGLGEPLGRTVGYRVRFEERASKETRILVVTEGILTRRLLADPLLEGVGCVILDEFHERSLDADLCLGFLRELLEARPELRLIVMSATLQAAPLAELLGGAPLVSCEVRGHPLAIAYRPAPAGERRPLPARVRAALLELLAAPDDDGGDLLVFLPGASEIRQALRELEEHPLPGQPELVPLYGALPAAEQDRALRPGAGRRVVLATNLAETSLTVPGVTAVIDSGLVKRLRYDPRLGLDRLELGQVSRASAEQRAGRAGRLAPGRVLRLWSAAEQAALAEAEAPELARVDLAPALLAILTFQPGDPSRLRLLEPLPAPALARGLSLLRALGALEAGAQTALSPLGRRLAALPVHPRLGAMLEAARGEGLLEEGALLAALLGERDLLARGQPATASESDLLHRRELFLELEAGRFAPALASRLGVDRRAAEQVAEAREQLLRLARGEGRPRRGSSRESPGGSSRESPDGSSRESPGGSSRESPGGSSRESPDGPGLESRLRRVILAGYPDRVCRRRAPGSPEAVMVGGRGVRLAEESGVREAELFVALEAEAGRPGLHSVSLVRQASAVDEGMLAALFPAQLTSAREVTFDERREAVLGLERRRFADLVLAEREAPVDRGHAAELLAEAAARRFAELFRPDEEGRQLLGRLHLAAAHLAEEGWPDPSEAGLRALLPALCAGRHSLAELARLDWASALAARLDGRQRALLERELPERLEVPSGSRIRVDYAPALEGGAPVLAVKLQELFGLATSPRVARGRVALVLHLLAPSGRPVQVTQDLASFWNTGYSEVRRTLRGRYPKHPWPEDPWTAPPTARTKRGGR